MSMSGGIFQRIQHTNADNQFWEGILKWYAENARDYPWRRTSNPYYVLMAEFLLQQTHVRKMQDVYDKLLAEYPSPQDLAQADISEVEQIIKPIGLKYRAGRLKKCAEIICQEFSGRVPDAPEKLRKLPGVGSYICDAVLCYAFGFTTVPIDTNVIRLFCRYFGYKSDRSRPRTDKKLSEAIRQKFNLFSSTRDPNLAVLDFAGLICTAKGPLCQECCLKYKCRMLEAC